MYAPILKSGMSAAQKAWETRKRKMGQTAQAPQPSPKPAPSAKPAGGTSAPQPPAKPAPKPSKAAPAPAPSKATTRDTAYERRNVNPRAKMTIDQARDGLAKFGMKLGPGRFDVSSKQTVYEVTGQNGKTLKVPAKNIQDWLKGRRRSLT